MNTWRRYTLSKFLMGSAMFSARECTKIRLRFDSYVASWPRQWFILCLLSSIHLKKLLQNGYYLISRNFEITNIKILKQFTYPKCYIEAYQLFKYWKEFTVSNKYRITSYSVLPWIVSTEKFCLASKKMKYCSNYLNWLQFTNSKKNSFST